MKIDRLPQEIVNQIVSTAELSPLSLLRLGKMLTPRDNKLSAAALDDQIWKSWSRPNPDAQAPHLRLSEAFEKRWSEKPINQRRLLQNLYQAYEQGASGIDFNLAQMSKDVDVQVALLQSAVAQGKEHELSRRAPLESLCDARIAPHLLSDPQWLEQSLPYTVFALQAYCDQAGLEIPAISKSDTIWERFSPETETQIKSNRSFFERAQERFLSKTPEAKRKIEQVSEAQRRGGYQMLWGARGYIDYTEFRTKDFDLMLAWCAAYGLSFWHAHPSFASDRHLALRALEWGVCFADLNDRLRDDDVVVGAAVKRIGEDLRYASDRLRGNSHIVKLVCANEASYIRYATAEFLQNIDLVSDAMMCADQKGIVYANLPDVARRDEKILAQLKNYIIASLENGNYGVNAIRERDTGLRDLVSHPKRTLVKRLKVPADLVDPLERIVLDFIAR